MKFLNKLGFLKQKKREERLFADISGWDDVKWKIKENFRYV